MSDQTPPPNNGDDDLKAKQPEFFDPTQVTEYPAMQTSSGVFKIGCGFLVAFSPMIMAWLATSPGSNMWSEGDSSSGGAVMWFMSITVPIGLIIGIIGLVNLANGSSGSKKK